LPRRGLDLAIDGPQLGSAGVHGVKGTETLDSASRDQFVLMDEAAQDVASSNAQHARNQCVGIRRRVGRSQVDPPVRPLRIVVGDVFAECRSR
jgi:hypothetical protein